jgi:transcriptional regulator with PAS, ATPase and Fis domain
MFGYAKGAFTGADKNKPGRFQEADGGTIFLDEIGDLPLPLQAKLLRVIEDREFYPLGSRKTTNVDVRIISASNQNLEQLIEEKRFRQDLFYRLNVMRITLPPLKDRKSDLPMLVSHILKKLCTTMDVPVKKLSQTAMQVLLNHDYPGNVRELENILEHAVIICKNSVIETRHLPGTLVRSKPLAENSPGPENQPTPSSEEKSIIIQTLNLHRWNRALTAKALDMDRSTLWRKMKKYQITQ